MIENADNKKLFQSPLGKKVSSTCYMSQIESGKIKKFQSPLGKKVSSTVASIIIMKVMTVSFNPLWGKRFPQRFLRELAKIAFGKLVSIPFGEKGFLNYWVAINEMADKTLTVSIPFGEKGFLNRVRTPTRKTWACVSIPFGEKGFLNSPKGERGATGTNGFNPLWGKRFPQQHPWKVAVTGAYKRHLRELSVPTVKL